MTAPIIIHNDAEDTYDDPSHPIPSLTALDIQVVKKSGGSDLVIVIASPIMSDGRSRQRLLDKIELYLGYICSPTFQASSGNATADNTSIIIKIHPDSENGIFEFIEECRPWVLDNNVSLKVEIIDQQRH